MLEKIKESSNFIKSKITNIPEIGIILGTGLGDLGNKIEAETIIDYHDIPNFPQSTVVGHAGKLIFGKLGGKNVVAMQGRFHYYEGYTMNEVVFPVRVLKLIGIEQLILSNAAGGMNPEFEIGDIMIINDHINLMSDNPLIGKNIDELGDRFPDFSEPYKRDYIKRVKQIASNNSISVREGVYAAVTGPTFETPAEYVWIRRTGADAVGMSTIPECIAARHMGLNVFAVSVITDLGIEGKVCSVSHQEVIEAANSTEPILTKLIVEFLKTL